MPTNLPPMYFDAEKRFKAAKTIEEKLSALEEMMSIMPHHKGTDKLRASLNQKYKKLKEMKEAPKKGARREIYQVKREGAGQIVLIGAPNTGKSTLLRALTNATPEIADYPFTTMVPVPGMVVFEDVKIQLVELPAITEDSMEMWVPNIIRTTDAAVVLADLSSDSLLDDLDGVINPLKRQKIYLTSNLPPEEERERGATYIRTMIFANKSDADHASEKLELLKEYVGDRYKIVSISSITESEKNRLPALLFEHLHIIRVYPKKPGHKLEKQDPLTLPIGSTVLDAAAALHKEIAAGLKYARAWGGKFHDGQQIARDYVLEDGIVIEFH